LKHEICRLGALERRCLQQQQHALPGIAPEDHRAQLMRQLQQHEELLRQSHDMSQQQKHQVRLQEALASWATQSRAAQHAEQAEADSAQMMAAQQAQADSAKMMAAQQAQAASAKMMAAQQAQAASAKMMAAEQASKATPPAALISSIMQLANSGYLPHPAAEQLANGIACMPDVCAGVSRAVGTGFLYG